MAASKEARADGAVEEQDQNANNCARRLTEVMGPRSLFGPRRLTKRWPSWRPSCSGSWPTTTDRHSALHAPEQRTFSKKVENHAHSVALHFAHYNFVRIHQTTRVTPTMEAGISDHVWTIEELVGLLG